MQNQSCGIEKHTTLQLLSYWDKIRDGRPAPSRMEIEPSKIYSILPETFILELKPDGTYAFRLAGTRLCQQFGQELRGRDFCQMWQGTDHRQIRQMLEDATRNGQATLVKFQGRSESNQSARFEMIILPLLHTEQNTTITRLLGSISVEQDQYWLGSCKLIQLELDCLEPIKIEHEWNDMNPQQGNKVSASGRHEIRYMDTERSSDGSRIVQINRQVFRVYDGGQMEKQ